MSIDSLLRVIGLNKSFAVPVLEDIALSVAPGEVVALTGENGAGKSTLSKIIAGLLMPDRGSMYLDGKPYEPRARANAENMGVRIVLQEPSLVPSLTVAENLQLRRIPARAGFIRFRELHAVAREQLQRVGLHDVDPSQPVDELSLGQQQLLEIGRGLMGNVRLLVLDEPTGALTEAEAARLFDLVRSLRASGVGIIYISHRLYELSRISDRIVVLRDGRVACDRATSAFTPEGIVNAMVGRDLAPPSTRSEGSIGPPTLRLQGLGRGRCVRDVSCTVHSGEIFGIAGLVGAGRTELLRLIFGADQPDRGRIYLDDREAATNIASPRHAMSCGIGLVPEDRNRQGLLPAWPLRPNVTLANLRAVSRRGWIDRARETSIARQLSARLRVRAWNEEQMVAELSGGNQQKVLLARWIHRDCRILLLDEPTRGVDMCARIDIYSELRLLATAGKALIIASSDLDELMLICDRIGVMSAGSMVRVFSRGEWSEQALLEAAFASHSEQAKSNGARALGTS